ncbi:MAG: hypothetical protein U5O39_16185 [Gammaproteobacteria bacterium]|nr:hypothetical protein [Gammaproteobacteria bacterium]
MKIGPMTYKPNANWWTAALLAIVILGFGAAAESRVSHRPSPAIASESVTADTIPQAILRLF